MTKNKRRSISISKKSLVALSLLFSLQTLAQEVATSFSSALSQTIYDGVTEEQFVSYARLTGEHGLIVPAQSVDSLNTDLDYTIMMWFKPMSDDWSTSLQYAVTVPESFQCYFSASGKVMCDSQQKCDKLEADVSDVKQGQWAHMTVAGSIEDDSSYLMISTDSQIISLDNKSYLAVQQLEEDFYVFLGSCEVYYNFNGGIRDFVFANQYITSDQAMRVKNHMFTWDVNILSYYRFSDVRFEQDWFYNRDAQYVQVSEEFGYYPGSILSDGVTIYNITKGDYQGIDFISNDICSAFWEYQEFINFDEEHQLDPIELDDRFERSQSSYDYTFSLTIRPSDNQCYTRNYNEAMDDCHLYYLDEVVMLYYESPNQMRFYFMAKKNYYQYRSSPFFVPNNEWVNIQLSIGRYSGYNIKVYDVYKRTMYEYQEIRDMHVMRPKPDLSVLKGFQGQAYEFIAWAEEVQLPVATQDLIDDNGQYVNENCLTFLRFTKDDIVDNPGTSSSNLTNYATSETYGQQAFNLSGDVTYQWTQWQTIDSQNYLTSTLDSSTALFDGVACNDGNKVTMLNNKDSFIRTSTPQMDFNQDQMTVEFWMKTPYQLSQDGTIFSLWSDDTQQSYMQIAVDEGQLKCFPFGIDSTTDDSQVVVYSDYSYQIIDISGWVHISCSFSSNTQAQGSMFTSKGSFTYYADLSDNIETLPAVEYTVSLGASVGVQTGQQFLFMKELRVWADEIEPDTILSGCYKQVDPTTFSSDYLIAYLRLASNNYVFDNLAYYTSASDSMRASLNSTYNDVTIVYDKEVDFLIFGDGTDLDDIIDPTSYTESDNLLVVCPMNSYQFDYNCFNQPVNKFVFTIYPVDNSDLSGWDFMFSLSDTSMINQDLISDLNFWYTVNDPVLQNWFDNDFDNSINFTIPLSYFKIDNTYSIQVQITNDQQTFYDYVIVDFVPIECLAYFIDSYSAQSLGNEFYQNKGAGDISFTVTQQTTDATSSCQEYQFFDTIRSEDITYEVLTTNTAYLLESQPVLDIASSDTGFTVTLPADQQSMLPVSSEIYIVLSLKMVNSNFEDILTESNYLMQNLKYSFSIYPDGNDIIVDLQAAKTELLDGDEIYLDASGTYITNVNYEDQYSDIEFYWYCPSQFSDICDYDYSSSLLITQDQFEDNGGVYGQVMTFELDVYWWSEQDSTYYYNSTSVDITWFNYEEPIIAFTYEEPLLATSRDVQTVTMYFTNFADDYIDDFDIVWDLTPALAGLDEGFFYTDVSGQTLIIPGYPNSFEELTRYEISVSVTHQTIEGISSTNSFSFFVQQPPQGGSIDISPSQGDLTDMFFLGIDDYTSAFAPVEWRVWSTTDETGETENEIICGSETSYLSQDIECPVYLDNTFPLIFEITDQSGESLFETVTMYGTYITADSDDSSALLMLLHSVDEDDHRYRQDVMAAMIYSLEDDVLNHDLSDAQILQQQEMYLVILQEIAKDLEVINYSKFVQNGVSEQIIRSAVSNVKEILSDPVFVNEAIAQKVIDLIDSINDALSFDQFVQEDPSFMQSYADLLSNFMAVSSVDTSIIFNGDEGRRLDQVRLNEEEIKAVNNKIIESTEKLVDNMCVALVQTNEQHSVTTDFFAFQVERFNQDTRLSEVMFDAQSLSVKVYTNHLYETFKNSQGFTPASLCVQAFFYFTNLKPFSFDSESVSTPFHYPNFKMEMMSQSGKKATLEDLDPQRIMEISYDIDYNTFVDNQSICMTYNLYQGFWDSESCQTVIDQVDYSSVECKCTMIGSEFLSIYNDASREAGEPLPEVLENIESFSEQAVGALGAQSYAYVAPASFIMFIMVMCYGFGPVMDRFNKKEVEKYPISQFEQDIINQFSIIKGVSPQACIYDLQRLMSFLPFRYWNFSLLVQEMHPVISIFAKYDLIQSRSVRASPFILQTGLLTFYATQYFGKEYRTEERSDNTVLDLQDLSNVICCTAYGLLLMLPVVRVSALKSKIETNQDGSIKIERTIYTVLGQLLMVCAVVVNILALGYIYQMGQTLRASNQYCMVASIFGAMLVSQAVVNMTYIGWQAVMSQTGYGWCLVSQVAQEVSEDQRVIRKAREMVVRAQQMTTTKDEVSKITQQQEEGDEIAQDRQVPSKREYNSVLVGGKKFGNILRPTNSFAEDARDYKPKYSLTNQKNKIFESAEAIVGNQQKLSKDSVTIDESCNFSIQE